MTRFRDVLFKNKNFTLLWCGQVISNFGDRLSQMALIALVWRQAPGSSLALAKAISFTIIPVFFIGPVAGAWVDRWEKRDVMIISDLLRGSLALFIPIFIVLKNMPLIYLVIFLIFTISRFFVSSKMGIIPELVAKDELLMANSLADTTKMIGNAIGLAAAGLLVNSKSIGATGGFLIYGFSFFLSASLLGMIVKREFLSHIKDDLIVATRAFEESIRRSIYSEVKSGIRTMLAHREMRFIIIVFSLLMGGIGSVYCVIITFIQNAFGTATKDLTFLMLYLMIGLFFGTVLYGRFGGRYSKRKIIYLSFVASGAAVSLFTLGVKTYPSIIIDGILAFLLGLVVSPIMVAANTLVHEVMPGEVRGRTFSSLEVIIHLPFLAFMFLTGILDRFIDKAWILIGCGLIFFGFGIAGTVLEARKRSVTLY
ncbi:MAG: MFS transporter [Candidatus Omnitrophica bacterium]|nr:MFS transporter [Candidatus Omnitrophota bacterium]